MRVALDYQIFAMQTHGGISRYFTRLAQGLSLQRQQVAVIAPLHQNSHLAGLPRAIAHGRHLLRYPAKTSRVFMGYNRIASEIGIAAWKPDVIHETYFWHGFKRRRACPVVVTVYDMIHELFPGDFGGRDKTARYKKAAVKRADHVICISENTKRELVELFNVPEGKLSVVHLGFDRFAPQTDVARYTTASGRPFVLYVGGRKGYKNFTGLIKAISISKRLLNTFDVVAFGGGALTPEESDRIAQLGFAENQVTQIGGDDELLGRLYSSAGAFVYPSLHEGFGIPPLEAMAHGCPVVCANTSSIPEVVGTAGAYFDPRDAGDIAQAIEDVVYSDSAADSLRAAGFKRIEVFSWETCVRETMGIYQRLA